MAPAICLVGSDSEPPIVGFFTTRILRVESPEAAANAAVRTVTAQWSNGTAYANGNRGSLPRLSVEWVKEDTFLGRPLFRGAGHTFYPSSSRAEPSRAEPSRAEPSRAEPSA